MEVVTKEVDRLIAEYCVTDFSELGTRAQYKLVALCIEHDSEYDWLCNAAIQEKTVNYLRTDTGPTAYQAVLELRKSAVDFYEPQLETLFRERVQRFKQKYNEEAGHFPTVDSVTGEVQYL